MKMLFLGDVVGRAGRDAVHERLPALRKELDLDFVVVNAENAAAGFGMTPKICDALFEAGGRIYLVCKACHSQYVIEADQTDE